MKLLAGLMDHQVLQRNKKNVCEIILAGQSDKSGELYVRVSNNEKILNDWNWKKIAAVEAGEFECVLSGIPIGGPYDITLRFDDTDQISFSDILVGDVWLLCGQSNMEGAGLLFESEPPSLQVRAFYMNDHWAVAKDPLHVLAEAVDPIHADLWGGTPPPRNTIVGAGLGIPFGKRMLQWSGVPQGLIACAHGGSSLNQWISEPHDQSGRSLFSATYRRFWKNGQHVAGIVWYQGCNDATENGYTTYTEKMIRLIEDMRREFHQLELPFVMVQLATFFGMVTLSETITRGWTSIREQQYRLIEHIPYLTVVPAIDLPLIDPIHINNVGQKRLARRLADAAWTLCGGTNAHEPPITFRSVRLIPGPYLTIEVVFDQVIGSLKSIGPALGFTLTDEHERPLPIIFRTDLDGERVLLRTCLHVDETLGGGHLTSLPCDEDIDVVYLHYGFSSAVHCTIVDEEDRSLPAFGPVPLTVRDGVWCVRDIRRSILLPVAGNLHPFSFPDVYNLSLGWKDQTFPTSFLNIHDEIVQYSDDRIVYFHRPFQCDEPMELTIGLGYDGPVKVWLDEKELYFDSMGEKRMIFDQHKFECNVATGEHDLVVCLATNFGNAWGVGLRIYRKDHSTVITKKLKSCK